ncbi:hypothetical protein ACGTN9_13030 [Halobacillus sp. MO56]
MEKNGQILIAIGWLSAIFALFIFPPFLGIVAFCMGVVLGRDYDSGKQAKFLKVAGVLGAIGGYLLSIILIG